MSKELPSHWLKNEGLSHRMLKWVSPFGQGGPESQKATTKDTAVAHVCTSRLIFNFSFHNTLYMLCHAINTGL